MIVQIRTGAETPLTTFSPLKSKTDAMADNLNYYLLAKQNPGEMPLFMQMKPGISRIDALGTDLETPGKYFLHFRAVSKREVYFYRNYKMIRCSVYNDSQQHI